MLSASTGGPADHLAAVVDADGLAAGIAGELTEVAHSRAACPQERMHAVGGVGGTYNLPGTIDREGGAEVPARQRAERSDPGTIPQECSRQFAVGCRRKEPMGVNRWEQRAAFLMNCRATELLVGEILTQAQFLRGKNGVAQVAGFAERG
jgi:hypothetical protein